LATLQRERGRWRAPLSVVSHIILEVCRERKSRQESIT
jgi:hypothetical protein